MFHSIIFLLLGATQYGPVQAHNDSLYIYNVYTESAKVFETSDKPEQWKTLSDSVQQVTAAAFTRLHKYNATAYVPADELNREALGVAYVYPKPADLTVANVEPKVEAKTEPRAEAKPTANAPEPNKEKEVAFKVLDEQTHFMTAPNGKGKIPYIVMNYYAKGRVLIRSEKLNPVTKQPIQVEQPNLTANAN